MVGGQKPRLHAKGGIEVISAGFRSRRDSLWLLFQHCTHGLGLEASSEVGSTAGGVDSSFRTGVSPGRSALIKAINSIISCSSICPSKDGMMGRQPNTILARGL